LRLIFFTSFGDKGLKEGEIANCCQRAILFVCGLPAILTLFIRPKVKETEAWKATEIRNWKEYPNAVKKHSAYFCT